MTRPECRGVCGMRLVDSETLACITCGWVVERRGNLENWNKGLDMTSSSCNNVEE